MAEVASPAERGRVEPLVPDVRVGAEPEQRLSQAEVSVLGRLVQGGLPWLVARYVGPSLGVDVEAEVDEELDRTGPPAGGRPGHQGRARRADLVGEPGMVEPQLVDPAPVADQRAADERLHR